MNTVRTKFHKRVQDSYSLRCVPQVHGVAYDLLRDVIETVEQELNMPQTTHLLLN
jgi:histidine ammonia-lyase